MLNQLTAFLIEGYHLIYFIIFAEIIFLFKVYSQPLDFDTSNHLYLGFLKSKKHPIRSSYKPGIKLGLPIIYFIFYRLFPNSNFIFRISNGILFLITYIILYKQANLSHELIIILLISYLLTHSAWINYSTSAAEFYQALLLLLALISPQLGIHPTFIWFIQILLICFSGYYFKLTSFIFLAPCALYSKIYQTSPSFFILGSIFTIIFGFYVYKSGKSDSTIKTYHKSRSFSNGKNIRFLILNPIFCIISLSLILIPLFTNPQNKEIALIASVIVIFLIQKMYMTYFFYPLIVFGTFIILQRPSLPDLLLPYLDLILAFIFFTHTIVFLLLPSKFLMGFQRLWVMGSGGSLKFIENEQKAVDWIKENIPVETNVYLWGSHVALLVQSQRLHIKDTYYNHNHLLFWSPIKDHLAYMLNDLKIHNPVYVIESQTINQIKFFGQNEGYTKIAEIAEINIYKKTEIT